MRSRRSAWSQPVAGANHGVRGKFTGSVCRRSSGGFEVRAPKICGERERLGIVPSKHSGTRLLELWRADKEAIVAALASLGRL